LAELNFGSTVLWEPAGPGHFLWPLRGHSPCPRAIARRPRSHGDWSI